MDIYTFRSEFERIVQPSRQSIYWLDALKPTKVEYCDSEYRKGGKLNGAQVEEKVHSVIATTLGLPNVISNIDKLHRFSKTKKDGQKSC